LVGFFVKALAGVGSSGAEFIKPGGNSIDGEVGAWEEKTGEGDEAPPCGRDHDGEVVGEAVAG
jgi:hypothetical protein